MEDFKMGFFSDLKDDLSQAVNELMPEDSAEDVKKELAEQEKLAAEQARKEQAERERMAAEQAAREQEEAEKRAEEAREAEREQMAAEEARRRVQAEAETAAPAEQTPAVEEHQEAAVEMKVPEMPVLSSRTTSDEVSVLTESMLINGNIATEGGLDVRGSIVGNVEALGKLNITGAIQGNSQAAEIFAEGAKITGELRSSSSIKVGQSTVIIGNIYASSAVIAGAIKGDIDVKGPVILDATAIVMGDIKSKSVQINNGAVVEGMCSQCYADVNPASFFEELKKMK